MKWLGRRLKPVAPTPPKSKSLPASIRTESLIFVDRVSDDVLEGLALYRKYADSRASDATLRTDWVRWFDSDDVGSAVAVIAKHGERVIGFYALLPTKMYIGGKVVSGAKGEFHVVHPDYRRAIAEGTGAPIPLALVSELKRYAHERGVLASFGKTRNSVFITRMTGAQPFTFAHYDYITSFRPIAGSLADRVPQWKQWGAVIATSLLRTAARISAPLTNRGGFREVEAFDESDVRNPAGLNCLVSRTADNLNFRFPATRYRKFVLKDEEQRPAYFVFARARAGAVVQMMDWSTMRVPPADFRALLREIASECSKAGAAMLHLPIPIDQDNAHLKLSRAGFLRAKRESTIFINCFTPELSAARDAIPWLFTNAHFGYYENAQ